MNDVVRSGSSTFGRASRRRVLGSLAAVAGTLAVGGHAGAAAPRRVAVVGAGMAGVACAWLPSCSMTRPTTTPCSNWRKLLRPPFSAATVKSGAIF